MSIKDRVSRNDKWLLGMPSRGNSRSCFANIIGNHTYIENVSDGSDDRCLEFASCFAYKTPASLLGEKFEKLCIALQFIMKAVIRP